MPRTRVKSLLQFPLSQEVKDLRAKVRRRGKARKAREAKAERAAARALLPPRPPVKELSPEDRRVVDRLSRSSFGVNHALTRFNATGAVLRQAPAPEKISQTSPCAAGKVEATSLPQG